MTKSITRAALGAGLILLIPLALQLTIGTGVDGQGWNWKLSDFIVIGALLFVAGLGIDIARRRMGKYRVLGIMAVVLGFLWLYAELAVGVFTNWGS